MTQIQTDDAAQFLMGSGVKSFKFAPVGATVKGTVKSLDMQQQRDIKDGKPKFWDDGKPMRQLRVVLATDLRDEDDRDDTGERAIYVKGNMQQAVRDAIKEAGADTIAVGGTLTVKYVKDGEVSKSGFNPPKEYKAKYVPPAATSSVSTEDLL